MAKGKYSVSPTHNNVSQSNGDLTVVIKDPQKDMASNGHGSKEDLPPPKETKDGEAKEEKKKEAPPPTVGVFELFRFADGRDRALILMGIMSACVHGAAMPLMIIVFGEMIDTFLGNDQYLDFWSTYGGNITATYNITSPLVFASNLTLLSTVCSDLNIGSACNSLINGNYDAFYASINKYIIYFIIIGAATLVISFLQLTGFVVSAYRQTQRIRTKLYHAILRQEIGWFDTHEPGELNTRLSDDVQKIEDGTSEKLGEFFQYLCAFLAGFVVGFVYGWKLTLVIISTSPLLMISSALMAKLQTSFTTKELSAYAKAGAVAEEVLGGIRTVVAFSGHDKECDRYNANLLAAKKQGVRKGFVSGMTIGMVFLIMFSTYALAFWYGAKLIREDPAYTGGRLIIVFFCVLIGAFSLGNAAPGIQNLGTARGAAHILYSIIDQKPNIDSDSEEGLKPDRLIGNIEFKDVFFNYPSRPDVPVLQGLNLEVKVGQTVALVGASGCGKSTTVQLLQRFYDPAKGSVFVDGNDLRDLNVRWLREHIGVVSQEPVLFATTIGENISYGREGVTQEEIEAAARNANAADFISKLPDGYNTIVGERGAQLSGGQKQRIAIARALVRDPKILLLDEATSALDTTSEAIVQAALDKAREGRTTLVIAHRLSTIKTADVIAGFDKGVIVEKGTHNELMELEGIYHTLVMNQTKGKEEEDEGDDDDKSKEEDSFIEDTIPVFERQKSFSRSKSVHEKKEKKSEKEKKEEEEAEAKNVSLMRIMRLNRPEVGYIALGSFAALITGSIQPLFGFIFASVISIFAEIDPVKQEAGVFTYSMLFLGIAAAAFLANLFQEGALGISGEMLTMRMRQMAFRAILRQEIGWFDLQENNVGALTTRLATDASTVKGATGSQLATVLRAMSSVIIGLTIGFYYSWALTLLILAFAPIIFMSGFIRMKLVQGSKKSNDAKALEEAGKVSVESIENIRTVASLSKERMFYNKFNELTLTPYNGKMKRTPIDAIAYGFSQSVQFLVNAAVFAFGAYLIKEHGLSFESMFKVFSAVVFTAMAVGQSSSYAPDLAKAKLAAMRIFNIVDREPPIDSYCTEGTTPTTSQGVVKFSEVCFSYPTRPDVKVLRGLDLQVRPGQTLALVGSSGCGKSTSIQLMERFYDPAAGSVSLDSMDIKSLNIKWLRSQISLVSQEPILFDCSIRQNIEYGDNSRQVPMDEVIAAARAANIHDFIAALPDGYETSVGDRGAQLSGGQKQRVAIARALVRNPKILLLDEATSALDTESEKIVQEALDRAREGRTCIVIAHRLSTIRNADAIAVIHNGKMAEIGTHSELLAKEGLYYTLNNAQAMAV